MRMLAADTASVQKASSCHLLCSHCSIIHQRLIAELFELLYHCLLQSLNSAFARFRCAVDTVADYLSKRLVTMAEAVKATEVLQLNICPHTASISW